MNYSFANSTELIAEAVEAVVAVVAVKAVVAIMADMVVVAVVATILSQLKSWPKANHYSRPDPNLNGYQYSHAKPLISHQSTVIL